jgi:phosphopantetheinyl transferase
MLSFAAMVIPYKISLDSSVIAVGQHDGQYEMREEDLREDELKIISTLSPRKKSEWLSSRELLYKIADLPERTQCLYDDFGKPYLKGVDQHISLSHSELWCAAMVSDRRCGVDVQSYTETVRRISDRFLIEADVKVVEASLDPLKTFHLFWGAKECLYKAYGKRKLGFREHLFISSIEFEAGTAAGEIHFEDLHLRYDIYFRFLPEVAWVFCIEHPAPLRRHQPGV